jgi:hypothetical protein
MVGVGWGVEVPPAAEAVGLAVDSAASGDGDAVGETAAVGEEVDLSPPGEGVGVGAGSGQFRRLVTRRLSTISSACSRSRAGMLEFSRCCWYTGRLSSRML